LQLEFYPKGGPLLCFIALICFFDVFVFDLIRFVSITHVESRVFWLSGEELKENGGDLLKFA